MLRSTTGSNPIAVEGSEEQRASHGRRRQRQEQEDGSGDSNGATSVSRSGVIHRAYRPFNVSAVSSVELLLRPPRLANLLDMLRILDAKEEERALIEGDDKGRLQMELGR